MYDFICVTLCQPISFINMYRRQRWSCSSKLGIHILNISLTGPAMGCANFLPLQTPRAKSQQCTRCDRVCIYACMHVCMDGWRMEEWMDGCISLPENSGYFDVYTRYCRYWTEKYAFNQFLELSNGPVFRYMSWYLKSLVIFVAQMNQANESWCPNIWQFMKKCIVCIPRSGDRTFYWSIRNSSKIPNRC